MRKIRFGHAIAAAAIAAIVGAGILTTPAGSGLAQTVQAQSLNCDLSKYQAASGLAAAIVQGALVVTWKGSSGTELRASYAIS